MTLPLMNSTAFVAQGYRDCPVFTQVEVVAIVMVIRRNPSDPHASRVLTSKDPNGVVVLKGQTGHLVKLAGLGPNKFTLDGYRSDSTVVHASAFVAVPHRSQRISTRHDIVGFRACSRSTCCV